MLPVSFPILHCKLCGMLSKQENTVTLNNEEQRRWRMNQNKSLDGSRGVASLRVLKKQMVRATAFDEDRRWEKEREQY